MPKGVYERTFDRVLLDECVRGHPLIEENVGWVKPRGARTSPTPICKVCAREDQREYRAAKREGRDPVYGPHGVVAERSRRYVSTSWYARYWPDSPDPESEFRKLFEACGGACTICGRSGAQADGRSWLHVDHDHACCPGDRSCGDCVRGLICNNCNRGIGYFGDNPDILLAAAAYLLQQVDVTSLLNTG